jgi:uncharacterized hydrophobic protein (TIGR00341 family)
VRLVEITIPAGKRDAVLSTLDDEGVDYVVTDETSGREYTGVVAFPLPTNAVEPVLDRLRSEASLDEDAFTIILDAETVISRRFDALKERYEHDEITANRIARDEIRQRAVEMAPGVGVFLVLTVISAVVATAGILLDSPAVVVGSMVIAPLIGPAMATSVGTVVADRELFATGVKLQVVGGLLAVASAAAFAFLVKTTNVVPPGIDVTGISQVQSRLTPDFLSLAVALGAGVAGALSISTGVSAALVGVMIAAALVPPTAVIGIGIAWELPRAVVQSSVLVLVNVLGINLAALATLWYAGYRPSSWFHRRKARTSTLVRVGVLVVAIALLSVFLGVVTYSSIQTATFQQAVETEVEDAVGVGTYKDLELLDTRVEYGQSLVGQQPDRVIVTVGRPSGREYPGLAADIEREIANATGNDVRVQVRFIDIQTSGPENASAAANDSAAPGNNSSTAGNSSAPGNGSSVYPSNGNSGSYPTASTAASSTSSTFWPSVTLM